MVLIPPGHRLIVMTPFTLLSGLERKQLPAFLCVFAFRLLVIGLHWILSSRPSKETRNCGLPVSPFWQLSTVLGIPKGVDCLQNTLQGCFHKAETLGSCSRQSRVYRPESLLEGHYMRQGVSSAFTSHWVNSSSVNSFKKINCIYRNCLNLG